MKNNKGFTVVELIASFALTMVIASFLFEVLIDVKDVFAETSVKTNIQEKLGIVSKNIKYILPMTGSHVEGCAGTGALSCNVNGLDGAISLASNQIIVAGQIFEMPESVQIDTSKSILTTVCPNGGNDCYLKMHLDLTSDLLTQNFEYDVVYYYKSI